MSDTAERVKTFIIKQLDVKEADQVTPDAKFIDDLGADSLDTVEIVMGLEEEFGIEIEDSESEGIDTVGKLTKLVEKKVAT